MKPENSPVRTTLFTGLVLALLHTPLTVLLGALLPYPWPDILPFLLYTGTYGLLLTRWQRKGPSAWIVPSLFLTGIAILYGKFGTWQFLVCVLATLSWMRSGFSPERFTLRKALLEGVVCFGGAGVAILLSSQSMVGTALAIWLFFLFQTLYFIPALESKSNRKKPVPDDFETAKRQTEKILNLDGGCQQNL